MSDSTSLNVRKINNSTITRWGITDFTLKIHTNLAPSRENGSFDKNVGERKKKGSFFCKIGTED